MKKFCFFMSLFFLTIHPTLTGSKTRSKPQSIKNPTCNVPAINPETYSPFGQKSDHVKLSCIRDNFSTVEIISQKLPIDRDNINRWPLSAISLEELLGDTLKGIKPFLSFYVGKALGDHDKIIPKILYFKQNSIIGLLPASIIGVELCFETEQKTTPGLSRIALFFVQNITKKEDTETPNKTAINHLTLYNADKNVLILSDTLDTGNIINTILEKLSAKYKDKIPTFLSNIIKNKVTSIGKNKIGLIIETIDNEKKTVNNYRNTYGLDYISLGDHNYLFYKKHSGQHQEPVKYLIESSKSLSLPINSNYYLYGAIMGYNEKDIEFKYQFEEYLRSIKKINSDNTIAWPYDFKDHKKAFDQWVKTKWQSKSLINFILTPHIDRKFQDDKKEAVIILKKLKTEYVVNVFKKAKSLPKEQHRKKIDNLLKVLIKLAEKGKTNAVLKSSDEIRIAEKEKNRNMILYKIHENSPIAKYFTPTSKKIKESQEKKVNKSAQENQSESEKQTEKRSSGFGNYLLEKITSPLADYFFENELEDPKNTPTPPTPTPPTTTPPPTTTKPNTKITSSESPIQTDIKKVNETNEQSINSELIKEKQHKKEEVNTPDNKSTIPQNKPIIETNKEEPKITFSPSPITPDIENLNETPENKSTIERTNALIEAPNKKITSHQSPVEPDIKKVNGEPINIEKEQTEPKKENIADNQRRDEQINPIKQTKETEPTGTAERPEAKSSGWGWGFGNSFLEKVTNFVVDRYFDEETGYQIK